MQPFLNCWLRRPLPIAFFVPALLLSITWHCHSIATVSLEHLGAFWILETEGWQLSLSASLVHSVMWVTYLQLVPRCKEEPCNKPPVRRLEPCHNAHNCSVTNGQTEDLISARVWVGAHRQGIQAGSLSALAGPWCLLSGGACYCKAAPYLPVGCWHLLGSVPGACIKYLRVCLLPGPHVIPWLAGIPLGIATSPGTGPVSLRVACWPGVGVMLWKMVAVPCRCAGMLWIAGSQFVMRYCSG